jgi:hypothetical protein
LISQANVYVDEGLLARASNGTFKVSGKGLVIAVEALAKPPNVFD